MRKFSDIKLGMLVETHKGIGRIVGISENFSCEIELEVRIIEGGEEFFIMQSEVTYKR